MSIIKKIFEHKKNKKSILFTTPSHSQGDFIVPNAKKILGEQYFKSDYSEIDGFDNLRNPTGIIKSVQEKITKIYETQNSFLLINGATSGILASVLAILNEQDKVLIARNCHISVYNALVLSGAKPIWVMPEYNSEWGIFEEIRPETIEEKISCEQNIKALIITSPTYEGVFSDIKSISAICKKHGILLIVDEAHGALLNFSQLKFKSALNSGADICIHSLHKTAGAPNQCALLHIGKQSIVKGKDIQYALNLINTTSPSYPLLSAIEATVEYLASATGQKNIKNLYKNIENFHKKLSPNINVYAANNDSTKLLLKINGIDPYTVAEVLNNDYKIEEEYTNSKSLLFLTGLGTEKKKLNRLCNALNKITESLSTNTKIQESYEYKLAQTLLTPKEAKSKNKKTIKKDYAIGKISGEIIIKYPPGIPILLPGEIITSEIINLLEKDEITIID